MLVVIIAYDSRLKFLFKSFWIGICITVPIQLNFYAFLKSRTKNKFEEIIKLIYKIELGR